VNLAVDWGDHITQGRKSHTGPAALVVNDAARSFSLSFPSDCQPANGGGAERAQRSRPLHAWVGQAKATLAILPFQYL
jgi:hypothetical protein